MKLTILFVGLQYILGFSFAVGSIFIFAEFDNKLTLSDSIFFGLVIGFIFMLLGVWLVGYFQLRLKHAMGRLVSAIGASLLGLIVFICVYSLISDAVSPEWGFLVFLLPLTGAIFGFNVVAARAIKRI